MTVEWNSPEQQEAERKQIFELECSKPMYFAVDIEVLRKAGLADYWIACFISGIKAWGASEERKRVANLMRDNPPTDYVHPSIMEKILPKVGN